MPTFLIPAPKQAPILYQYGAIARLNSEDTIESLLYKNRSTVSIEYVGVHNALMALYGKSYDTDSEMIDKGVQMVQFMRTYCDKLKAETNIGFSLYSTLAETLATKFCRSDVSDFGIIRHTAYTKMINSGMSLKSVQMLMGYSDASITLDIYTHITNDRIKEELNLLK